MSKIKYINCFGTSNTAGGGFEFESTRIDRAHRINKVYSNFKKEEKTQFNFSWPGQLQKILKKTNIKVSNYGKSGYGNQRTFRKSYDLINSVGFNKDEHIFLIEFADLGREEFFCKELNDYIIYNYHMDFIDGEDVMDSSLCGAAKSYHYDTSSDITAIDKVYRKLNELYPLIFEMKNKVEQLNRELDFFINYLESKKIIWYITSKAYLSLWDINRNFNEKEITFGDGQYFKQFNCFHTFATHNNMTISFESLGKHDDFHPGYISNEIISKTIYNFLCDKSLIDGKELDIDYKNYKEMDMYRFIAGDKNLF